MILTIEHESITVSINDDKVVTIDEAMELVKSALLAVGFHPDSVKSGFESMVEQYETDDKIKKQKVHIGLGD